MRTRKRTRKKHNFNEMFASEEKLNYTQFMYNMQWTFYQDVDNDYFSEEEKTAWLELLPQVWLGVSDQESIAYHDILRRLCQLFGKEQVDKLLALLVSLQ